MTSNSISCTVPVFHGNDVVPFPGIREWKMTGIPGRPGNGSPGMPTLAANHVHIFGLCGQNKVHRTVIFARAQLCCCNFCYSIFRFVLLDLDDIILVLQQKRLRWYGLVLRKEDNDWVKKCMQYQVEGARPRGRPKKTWRSRDCGTRTVRNVN